MDRASLCGEPHCSAAHERAQDRNFAVATVYLGPEIEEWSRCGGLRTNTQSRTPGLRGPSPLLRLQSDERLIALTRRGQHAAFEALCSRYQSRLLSFCRHMLGSREDAEDVLQEVFAAAFNAVLADEREINVRPWLYRIARNRSLNHLRRASAIGVDSMDVHFADHGLSTGDRVIRRESFRQLLADVQQLPETQRTALLLREIDALSYDQIAHAMETTVPSVKSLLVRARISLAGGRRGAQAELRGGPPRARRGRRGPRQAERTGPPPRARLRPLPLLQEAAQGQQPCACRDAPGRPAADVQEAHPHQARRRLCRRRPRWRDGRSGRWRNRRRRRCGERRGERCRWRIHRWSRRACDQGCRGSRRGRDRHRRRGRRRQHTHHHSVSHASIAAVHPSEPVILRQQAQPVSTGGGEPTSALAARHLRHQRAVKAAAPLAAAAAVSATPVAAPATTPAKPADAKPPAPQVTQVTSETTELPRLPPSKSRPRTRRQRNHGRGGSALHAGRHRTTAAGRSTDHT